MRSVKIVRSCVNCVQNSGFYVDLDDFIILLDDFETLSVKGLLTLRHKIS